MWQHLSCWGALDRVSTLCPLPLPSEGIRGGWGSSGVGRLSGLLLQSHTDHPAWLLALWFHREHSKHAQRASFRGLRVQGTKCSTGRGQQGWTPSVPRTPTWASVGTMGPPDSCVLMGGTGPLGRAPVQPPDPLGGAPGLHRAA